MIAPCNYIHDYISDVGDTIDPRCDYNRTEQFKYIEKINLLVLYNNQRLDPQQFGENSVINESKIFRKQINGEEPNWVKFDVQMNLLDDETTMVQWG